uniref:Uncharacterized protein n=1 Tax=Cyanoderma ruficeps TaxID=181631 RepID=A0A8C3QJ43_9PASS
MTGDLSPWPLHSSAPGGPPVPPVPRGAVPTQTTLRWGPSNYCPDLLSVFRVPHPFPSLLLGHPALPRYPHLSHKLFPCLHITARVPPFVSPFLIGSLQPTRGQLHSSLISPPWSPGHPVPSLVSPSSLLCCPLPEPPVILRVFFPSLLSAL